MEGNNLKTLLVTINFPPLYGGVQDYLYSIAKYSNLQTVILAPRHTNSEVFDKKQSFKIFRADIFENGKPKRLKLFKELFTISRKERIEIIQCGEAFPTGPIVLLLKLIIRTPYVLYTYGLDIISPQSNLYKKILLKLVLVNAERVFTISEFTKSELIKIGVPKERIVKVTPGIRLDEFLINFDKKKFKKENDLLDSKILLSVGRLVERKGVDNIIRALPLVIKKHPNIIYLIIGEGPYLENLTYLVKTKKVEKYVKFLGPLDRKTLIKYLYICDLFIMISRFVEKSGEVEGFGIVYLEANACKKPVLGSRSGGIEDAVEDGKNGLLVSDPTSVEETSKKILMLIEDEKYAKKLGDFGFERVKESFQWKHIIKKVDSVLNSL